MRNGNLLTSCVHEICIIRIHDSQGVDVVQCRTLDMADNFLANTPSEKSPIFGRRKRDDHLSR